MMATHSLAVTSGLTKARKIMAQKTFSPRSREILKQILQKSS